MGRIAGKETLLAGLREHGNLSSYAQAIGVHQDTLKSRFLEVGIDPFKAVESRRGRSAKVYVQAWSGTAVYLAKPTPDMIHLADIAHSLAYQCRFTGHTSDFMSVAEHSVNVSARVLLRSGNPLWALVGLLHDAHEAYIGDMSTPLKGLVGPRYDGLRAKLDDAIAKRFFGRYPKAWFDAMEHYVPEADRYCLLSEAVHLRMDGWRWDGEEKVPAARRWVPIDFVPEEDVFVPMLPVDARRAFLDTFSTLEALCKA